MCSFFDHFKCTKIRNLVIRVFKDNFGATHIFFGTCGQLPFIFKPMVKTFTKCEITKYQLYSNPININDIIRQNVASFIKDYRYTRH